MLFGRPSLVAAWLGLLSTHSPAASVLPAPPPAELEAVLRAVAAESGGTLGVKVVHLGSGREASLNAAKSFPMASCYKLPIAVVVLAKVDAGELSLGQEVEVRAGELRRTASRVDPWTPGSRVPVAKLLDAMLTESDNTACDVLLRLLGGARAVDAWLDAHGFPAIDVTWSELLMAAVESGVEPLPTDGACDHVCLDSLVAKVPRAERDRAGRAFEQEARNAASPDDLARFLVALHGGKLLSPASTARLLATMERNRTGDRRIRALLPKGTKVEEKTGTIGRSTNDVGFIELPAGKGTIAVVILVKGSEKPFEARERAIAKAAKAAYDAFTR